MLTGTPISKPTDAYAYVKLNTPELYRSYAHFEALHVLERDYFKAPTKFGNLDILKKNLELRSIKRTKEELHGYNLTPLYPDTTYELSTPHIRLYRKLVEDQLLLYGDGTKIDATSVTKLMHAVQQIVVNYDHFANDPTCRSMAYDLIDEVIEETQCADEGRSKLIIWTKYKMTSRSVLAYLNKRMPTVAAYSEVDSETSVKRFLEDPRVRVLVGQYQSCGAGLNPQGVCSEALFLELETTPLLITQAVGRIDRVGQRHKPTVRFAVAKGTVQERLLRNLLKNDDLVNKVVPTVKGLRDLLLGE
jgi:SNF2 family DNA or RNA helicase